MSCQVMANEVIELLREKAVNSDCPDYDSDCSDYLQRVELALRQTDLDKALDLCRHGPASCSETSIDAEYCRAIAQMYLGVVYHSMGNLEEAENWYRQSANIFSIMDRDDSRWNEALAVYALGLLWQSRGALEEAQKSYHRSLRLLQPLKKRGSSSNIVLRLLQRPKKSELEHRIQTRMEHLSSLRQQRETLQQRTDSVPIIGMTAAGKPILAVEVRPEDVFSDKIHLRGRNWKIRKVPGVGEGATFELKPGSTYFALEIKGISMTRVGVNNGDYVIFRQQPNAEPGEIAVLRIDYPYGSSSTVKRFDRQGYTILLKAENPEYQPQVQVFQAGDPTIEILGKVVAVASVLQG